MTMDPEPRRSRRGVWLMAIVGVAITWAAVMAWLLTREMDGPDNFGRPPYAWMSPALSFRWCG